MKLLWAKFPQPAYDLMKALEPTKGWHQQTVKTLLGRLVKKEALSYEKYKNLYLYQPLVAEEDCIREESESFLNRVFDGAFGPMLVHFAEQKKLSPAKLKKLKKILEEE